MLIKTKIMKKYTLILALIIFSSCKEVQQEQIIYFEDKRFYLLESKSTSFRAQWDSGSRFLCRYGFENISFFDNKKIRSNPRT
jgi:hypothetical protein